jgi:alkylhydroperoxidase family enzyme
MAFIRTVAPSEAEGAVREMYEQVRRRFGYVPNWAQAFSLRPSVRDGWAALLTSIQSNLPVRTYELATLAAARALRSTYCSLAHGSVLADKVFDAATVTAIAKDAPEAPLEPRERAMMAFVGRPGGPGRCRLQRPRPGAAGVADGREASGRAASMREEA